VAAARHHVPGVLQLVRDNRKALARALLASWEVDDERATSLRRGAAGEHRALRDRKARCTYRLGDARHFAIGDGVCDRTPESAVREFAEERAKEAALIERAAAVGFETAAEE
jgi:hypothetical protein